MPSDAVCLPRTPINIGEQVANLVAQTRARSFAGAVGLRARSESQFRGRLVDIAICHRVTPFPKESRRAPREVHAVAG
jgi:hypothetical protein